MFENLFTRHLEKEGWTRFEPMSFKSNDSGAEILFDTSNQIEIFVNGRRIRSIYLHELQDLIRELQELSIRKD